MSEYQYVALRAVDRPLTDRELEYAGEQSSRAEITRWSFENEYHYGDFHGNVDGLLRHGYDVYLHYANYGTRIVALRLPAGLPFPQEIWSQYLRSEQISWKKDAKGPGGNLKVEPFHDALGIDQLWNLSEYVDDVVELRKLLLSGDLRALYVLWLCAANDDYVDPEEEIEPPVPGGLAECVDSCGGILDFFGLDPLILVAASEGAPAAPTRSSQEDKLARWIDALGDRQAKDLLKQLLGEDTATVKAKTLTAILQAEPAGDWPTAPLKRTLRSLIERAEAIHDKKETQERNKREAKALCERQKRLEDMRQHPDKWLRETDTLVNNRGVDNYTAAADILNDLREAIGGSEGTKIAQSHAAHLTKTHPTLNKLKSLLRERGLLK